jgi:Ger(x)C family germination protein
LKSKISNEEITSNGIHKMMHIFSSSGYLVPVILNEYFVETGGVAKSSYLPVIDIEKSEDDLSGKIIIEEMAIFKDDRLVGILSIKESRMLAWLLNKHKGSMIVFPFEPDESVSLEVSEASSRIVPYISNGEFYFKIICRGKAYLREMKNMKMDPESMKKIEQNAKSFLINQLNELIDKSQKEFNTDFIGFSKAIHNEAPQKWFAVEKKWDEMYPAIKYEIDFKVDLINVGMIKNSELTDEEKEEKK